MMVINARIGLAKTLQNKNIYSIQSGAIKCIAFNSHRCNNIFQQFVKIYN